MKNNAILSAALTVTEKAKRKSVIDSKAQEILADYDQRKKNGLAEIDPGEKVDFRSIQDEMEGEISLFLDIVGAPSHVNPCDYMEALSRLNQPFLEKKLDEYADLKNYVSLALQEREKWGVQGDEYDYRKASEKVRMLCKETFEGVRDGRVPQLCHRVETVTLEPGDKILAMLDAKGDTPILETCDKLIKNLGKEQDLELNKPRNKGIDNDGPGM